MIKQFLKSLTLLISSMMLIAPAHASHCYSYTVRHDYKLLTEEGGIFLQETVKDYNTISYVSQEKTQLKEITDKDFQVISEEGANILFMADGAYYLIRKDSYQAKEYSIKPLFSKQEVSKIVANQFFLVSGNWYYVFPSYQGKYAKQKLSELKGDLEIIADFNRGEILLKGEQAVYIYYMGENRLKKIPELTPSQNRFFQSLDFYSQHHYLYDDDTFFLTDIRFNYRDITQQFKLQGKTDGFTQAEIHSSYAGDSIDTKDGFLWLYGHRTLPEVGEDAYFTPVQANYLNAYKDLYQANGKVYANNGNLIQNSNPVDISQVQQPDQLHLPYSGIFSDNVYEYNLENNELILAREIIVSRSPENYVEIQNNKILIGTDEIKTGSLNGELVFLGSTVNVIQGCDGREGGSVIVEYFYFFKDDKNVYVYSSFHPKENLKLMPDVSPQDLQADDYETLQKLTNPLITKESSANN